MGSPVLALFTARSPDPVAHRHQAFLNTTLHFFCYLWKSAEANQVLSPVSI